MFRLLRPTRKCYQFATRQYSMSSSTQDVAQEMILKNVSRAAIFTDEDGELKATHSFLDDLVTHLKGPGSLDYDQHEAFFLEVHPKTQSLMGAALWRTIRGQGCGGIRLRTYSDLEEYVNDGLRLAQGMGRKSALAGLWWGGGKGVIAAPGTSGPVELNIEDRQDLLQAYGRFVTSMRGAYVGAEDVGICVDDVDVAFQTTRFTTCISPSMGGSGNPSVPTAHGIVAAMEGALAYAGLGDLNGKTVAVQGLGNVGGPMVGFLLDKGVERIIGSDVDANRVAAAASLSHRVDARLVDSSATAHEKNAILAEAVDIVSPCGFGGVINADTVPQIQAKIVCGAANNQLADPSDDYGMSERGILYVPDFVANRMGIVNCANEQYGRVGSLEAMEDPSIARHFSSDWSNSVPNIVQQVLGDAAAQGITTVQAANTLSDVLSREPHPIWGHRTKHIIRHVLADGWSS